MTKQSPEYSALFFCIGDCFGTSSLAMTEYFLVSRNDGKNTSSLREVRRQTDDEAISEIFGIVFLYWRLLHSLRSLAMTVFLLFFRFLPSLRSDRKDKKNKDNSVIPRSGATRNLKNQICSQCIVFKISHPFLRQGFEITKKQIVIARNPATDGMTKQSPRYSALVVCIGDCFGTSSLAMTEYIVLRSKSRYYFHVIERFA